MENLNFGRAGGKTAAEICSGIRLGWNLGNTLDAPSGETAWGQPVTTLEMIKTLKNLGFDALRIPVSWGLHMSGEKIDKRWLDRVREVAGYACSQGMYVVINSHHDNDFYYPNPQNSDKAVRYIGCVWSQAACAFKDFGERLIFECMNEPRLAATPHEWVFDPENQDCIDSARVINLCNEAFLKAVRDSEEGGADGAFHRTVLLSCYAASPTAALDESFKTPADYGDRHALLSVHAYCPHLLCMDGSYKNREFVRPDYTREIEDFYERIAEKYGFGGAMVTETGCTDKQNPAARQEWGREFVSAGKKRGMPCFIWDNSEVSGPSDTDGTEKFGLFDRRGLRVFSQSESYYKGIVEGSLS